MVSPSYVYIHVTYVYVRVMLMFKDGYSFKTFCWNNSGSLESIWKSAWYVEFSEVEEGNEMAPFAINNQ